MPEFEYCFRNSRATKQHAVFETVQPLHICLTSAAVQTFRSDGQAQSSPDSGCHTGTSADARRTKASKASKDIHRDSRFQEQGKSAAAELEGNHSQANMAAGLELRGYRQLVA